MSEEIFKSGLSAAQQATAKLNDVMNDTYEKEVDLMFGRLHEQQSNPQSSDYQNNDYDKNEYTRVGFSSRKVANEFVSEMNSMGVEVVVSPVKLNGQYLAEIPNENEVTSAPTKSSTADNNMTAGELINSFNEKNFEKVEEVNSKERGEGADVAGQEASALFNYMARNTGELGKVLLSINNFVAEYSKYNANANDKVFENSLNENGNVTLNSGTRTAKATVINNTTVVINGRIVTDEKVRNEVLTMHQERIEKAAKYVEKDAEKRDKWIKKGKNRTTDDWNTHRDNKKFANHPNRAKNSQAVLDNMYRQEYTVSEVTNYANRTGGQLDDLINTANIEVATLLGQKDKKATDESLIGSLSKDFNINVGTLTRTDMLKINEEFITRAADKGYQFVTATGKFDVEMLKNLSKEDLLKLGISAQTQKALIKLNTKEAWGGKNAALAHTGVAGKLARKGMQAIDDEDLNKIVSTSQKSARYVKQVRTSIRQFSQTLQTKIDIRKAKSAGKKVKKNNGISKTKTPKAKKPSVKNERTVNKKANEKYIKKQEKKLKRLERSENGLIGRTRKSINQVKQKIANNKYVKAFTKAFEAVKTFLVKIIALFIIIILVLEALMILIAVVVMMIQSLLNALPSFIEKLVPDYFDTSAVFQLYQELQKEENTWVDLIKDPDTSYEVKDELNYGVDYDNFTTYISSINNLIVDDSNNLYINPFWQAGSNAVSLETNKSKLTSIEEYDGENTSTFSANVNAYGKKEEQDEKYGTYVSTESGHTSNLKDILSMLDVMYQFETDDASDQALTSMLGGMTPAQIDWENFKNNVSGFFKWVGTNVSEWWNGLWGDEEPSYISFSDAKGNSVSYGTLENYILHLFELSHQQQISLTVDYYEVGDVSATTNGNLRTLNLSQEEASKIGICVEPETSYFKLAYNTTTHRIVPCIIGSDGTMYDLSTGQYDVILSMTNGTYIDNDQCLWSGMGSDEDTLNAIKNYISSYISSCWSYSDSDSTTEARSCHVTASNWYDTEDEAKAELIGKLREQWDKYDSGTVSMGRTQYTLNSDETQFTHIWYQLYDFSDEEVAYDNITTREVEDGFKKDQYYYSSLDNGEGGYGDWTTDSANSSGHKVKWICFYYEDAQESLDEHPLNSFECADDWYSYHRANGNIAYRKLTDETFEKISWTNSELKYKDSEGGSLSEKTIYNGFDKYILVDGSGKEMTYKTQYLATGATVHMYDKITDIYKRNCLKHTFRYCGGHVSFHSQGITYSMTNEQLAMAGAYNDKSQYPVIEDFDYAAYGYSKLIGKHGKIDWSTITSVGQASTSGGSQSPIVNVQGSYTAQRGLNLYTDGANEFKSGYRVNESGMKLVRDIFDVDCMVDKGKNVFPFGSSYEEYDGWNADNMTLALTRTSIDWYGLYGFDIPIELGGNTIADEDIGLLIEALKNHYGTSFNEDREEAVRTALTWVGRGHYSENHQDHDFLTELCHAHSIQRTVNGVTRSVDNWFDVNCTASDDKGFVKFVLSRAGVANPDKKLEYTRTYTGYDSLKPGDIIIHQADVGSWSKDSDGLTHVTYNELEISLMDKLDFFSDDILTSYSDEKYVIFLGVIDEDLELRGMDGDTITIKAGEPITIDLNLNREIGTVRLRTKTASSWSDSGVQKNYYWVTNPDSRTKYVKFN